MSPTWSWSPVRPSTTTRPGCPAGCCASTHRCRRHLLTAQLLRLRWIRHLPLTFGALSTRRVPENSGRRPCLPGAPGALEEVACRRYLSGEGGTMEDHEKVSGSGHRNEEL